MVPMKHAPEQQRGDEQDAHDEQVVRLELGHGGELLRALVHPLVLGRAERRRVARHIADAAGQPLALGFREN